MGFVPYFVVYLCLIVFTLAVVARFFMWSRCRCTCGGSSTRWPTRGGRRTTAAPTSRRASGGRRRREVSLFGELKVMVPEILFLVALREHNQKLWTRSFPFHFGLYLVGCIPR